MLRPLRRILRPLLLNFSLGAACFPHYPKTGRPSPVPHEAVDKLISLPFARFAETRILSCIPSLGTPSLLYRVRRAKNRLSRAFAPDCLFSLPI